MSTNGHDESDVLHTALVGAKDIQPGETEDDRAKRLGEIASTHGYTLRTVTPSGSRFQAELLAGGAVHYVFEEGGTYPARPAVERPAVWTMRPRERTLMGPIRGPQDRKFFLNADD